MPLATLIAVALGALASVLAACFDWRVPGADPPSPDGGFDGSSTPPTDGAAADGRMDAAGSDAGADVDAEPDAQSFPCDPFDEDGGARCVAGSERCCGDAIATLACQGNCDAAHGINAACTASVQCGAASCCWMQEAPTRGYSKCAGPAACAAFVLCTTAGECIARDAGTLCDYSLAENSPPYKVCR